MRNDVWLVKCEDGVVRSLEWPSRTDTMMRVRSLMDGHDLPVSGVAILKMVIDLSGDSAVVYRADQYIYAYARHEGYSLPPYALAGCGEIREFLADQEAEDLPHWYEGIGVDRALYEELYRYDLLVLTDIGFIHQAIPLEATWAIGTLSSPGSDDEASNLALTGMPSKMAKRSTQMV